MSVFQREEPRHTHGACPGDTRAAVRCSYDARTKLNQSHANQLKEHARESCILDSCVSCRQRPCVGSESGHHHVQYHRVHSVWNNKVTEVLHSSTKQFDVSKRWKGRGVEEVG